MITHIEDLPLEGPIGIHKTVSILKAIQHQQSITLSLKWDGSPAIIFGTNPDNGKFFISLKSMAHLMYTNEDIDQYITIPDLNRKMKIALKYLPELGQNKIYQCDIMWTKENLWVDWIAGKRQILMRPNEIVYSVPEATEIASEFSTKRLGIAVHTEYTTDVHKMAWNHIGNDGIEQSTNGTRTPLKSRVVQSPVEYNLEQSPNIMIFPITTSIILTSEDTTRYSKLLSQLEVMATKVNPRLYSQLAASHRITRYLRLYQNSTLKTDSLKTLLNGITTSEFSSKFYSFVETQLNKDILTLHRKKSRENRIKDRDIFLKKLVVLLPVVEQIKAVQALTVQLKMIILDHIPQNMFGTWYKDDVLVPGKHEGLVVTDHLTDIHVKLVDRENFSRRNFRL